MTVGRPEQSASEISALPRSDSAEFRTYVMTHAQRFCPETLVYLIRKLATARQLDLVEHCAKTLTGLGRAGEAVRGGHCEPVIRAIARNFRCYEDDDVRDFRSACHLKMWEAIVAGSAAKPFWEERFFLALKQAAIDVGRSMLRERTRSRAHNGEAMSANGPTGAQDEASTVGEFTQAEIEDAIQRLPERERQAAWSRWVLDLPVESSDPTEITISKQMGVSCSMVRRYLRSATKLLRAQPAIQELVTPEERAQ